MREYPTVTAYKRELASSHQAIGNLLNAAGHTAEARQSNRLALTIRERLARENPTIVADQRTRLRANTQSLSSKAPLAS